MAGMGNSDTVGPANVLSALARSAPLSDASIRAEFIAVLKTVSSDSEYRRVMDQLEK